MEVARLTTVADYDGTALSSGLRSGAAAGGAFAQAITAALATVGAAAVRVGLVMDDALDTIRIRTGQTGKALEDLGASFRDVFRAGPDGAQQASDALTTLRQRTGQTGDGLEALTTQILTLSRITKSDLNSNVADSARLFTSWGVAVNEQAGTLDMLFRTYQQTGVSIDALLGKLVTAGPVFRSAGFDIATSAALLGGFEQAGVSTERVVASMTAAWRFFGKNQIDAQTGIRETIARIQELGPGAEAAALGVKVFGRGAVDMVAAIQSGRLNVDALAASIANGTDTIEAAAKATDGFTENLAILRNRATLALEPFGTAILETFNRGLLAVLEPSRALTDALHRVAQAAVIVSATMMGRMVPALALVVRGFAASTTAAIANAVAMLRGASAAGVFSAAAAGLRTALAFLGGPLGVAVTVVLSGIGLAMLNQGRRARDAAAENDRYRQSLVSLSETELVTRLARLNAERSEVAAERQRLIDAGQYTRRAVNIRPTVGGVGVQQARENARAGAGLRIVTERGREADRTLAGVAARVSALSGALVQLRANAAATTVVAPTVMPNVGPLDFEGENQAAAQAGRGAVDLLRERIDLLTAVTEAERGLGRDAVGAQQALIVEYERAERLLRSMGDAARLPPDALQNYRDLLDVVNQLRPATVRTTANLRPALPSLNLGAAAAQVGQANTRTTAQFVAAQAVRVKNALAEGARAAAERLREATDNIRRAFVGWADSLPGVADARSGFNAARAGGSSVARSAVAGAGMAAAMEFLVGVAETLGPAMEALLLPVRLVGEAFGAALIPVMRALFPVFRLVAVAATYVGEIFFRVAGGISVAIGGLIRGIGRVVNLLPGSLGNPLIAMGQTLVDLGRGFQEGADGLARARDELAGLTFDDAARRINNSVGSIAESLSNVPPIFDLALRRMQAGRLAAGSPAPSPSPTPTASPGTGGASGGQPANVTIAVTVQVDGRAASTDREFLRFIKDGIKQGLRTDVELQNAARTAVLGAR